MKINSGELGYCENNYIELSYCKNLLLRVKNNIKFIFLTKNSK